jgi:hypothetical protein
MVSRTKLTRLCVMGFSDRDYTCVVTVQEVVECGWDRDGLLAGSGTRLKILRS